MLHACNVQLHLERCNKVVCVIILRLMLSAWDVMDKISHVMSATINTDAVRNQQRVAADNHGAKDSNLCCNLYPSSVKLALIFVCKVLPSFLGNGDTAPLLGDLHHHPRQA